MEPQAARQIIQTLAQGVHPVTGELMADNSPFNAPTVIRALFVAAEALGPCTAVPDAPAPGVTVSVRPRRPAPPNAGKPWQVHEDEKLDAAFAAGVEVEQIAVELGRTQFSVRARLVKFGKLAPLAGMRFMTKPPANEAATNEEASSGNASRY